jgi:putative DNA primase/helicase
MSELLEAALTYAARGWRVMPLYGVRDNGTCMCKTPSCHAPGKHPLMQGKFDRVSTVESVTINNWWSTYPAANIGIVCGSLSGMWALDIDGAHGLMELEQFEEGREGGPLPKTPRVRTGSGGLHFYWAWQDGVSPPASKIGAHFGVDVKSGNNSYVVAPPSRHISGNQYEWEELVLLEPAPYDLVRWVKGGKGEGGQPGDEWPSIDDAMKNGVPEGKRDDALFHYALMLRDAGVLRHEVENIIKVIASRCVPPFPEEDALAKVKSAWKHERPVDDTQRNWAGTVGGATVLGGGAEGQKQEVVETLLWPGFGGVTDRANALRLGAKWEDAYPLVGGGWILWTGTVWKRVERPSLEAGHALYGLLTSEIGLTAGTVRDGLVRWRHISESLARINAALTLLESEPVVSVRDLDADPWLLGVRNGVLDLRSGEVRDYERDDFITRCANADWLGGDVDCVRFKETLAFGVTDEREDVATEIAAALQCFLGVCLTGVSVKNFLVLHGPGNTGKTSLLEAFVYALGGYAGVAPRGLLTVKRGSNETHPTILTELEGLRFIVGSEPGAGEELNIELIKDITGGSVLKARRMRQDFYEFRCEAKPVVDTNHTLRLRDVSAALEERMISLGLLSEVPPARRKDRTLLGRELEGESSGVLAWAWRGLQKVLEEEACGGVGFVGGDLTAMLGGSVIAARREEVGEQDVIRRFVAECIEETGHAEGAAAGGEFLPVGRVRDRVGWWCLHNDVPWGVDVFMRELRSRLASGSVGLGRRYGSGNKYRVEGRIVGGWWALRLREEGANAGEAREKE